MVKSIVETHLSAVGQNKIMSHNNLEIPLNSTSNSTVMKWQCFGLELEEIYFSDYLFQGNVYASAFVNSLSAVFGLLSNSLILFGACKYRMIRILGAKLSKALTIFLAIQGMFSAAVIQPFYVAARLQMLANIHNPFNVTYCLLLSVVFHGTKLLVGFAIATVFGMNIERYIAVVHPHRYKTYQRRLLKLLILLLVIIPAHFTFSDVCERYTNISKLLTAIFTFVPYCFTVFVYIKIYLKLRDLDRARDSGNTNGGSPAHRPNTKKTRSLTSFIVVGSYLVCYLPMIVLRVTKLDETSSLVKNYLRPWASTLLLSSFSVNALVYGWRSAKISSRKVVTILCGSPQTPSNDSTV